MTQGDSATDPPLSLHQFRRVVEACDRFENALRAGADPSLEDFLGDTSGEERSVLRSELLALKKDYRKSGDPDETRIKDRTGQDGALLTAEPPILETVADDDLEILEEIGRGGMGVVYRARQVTLDRVVALKMIHADSRADPRCLARFRTEVQAVARLSHANFVQIYEVGVRDGRPCFSMELVNGGSLARKLTGGPLPVRQSAQLVEILARAMHVAHRRGILHRDLKPANILLTLEGQPKITDFGLAKIISEAGVSQTNSGMIVGTPTYMAPEQARGEPRDLGPEADIYALGATLYEMLTGRPPFRAATPLETLLEVLSQDPLPPSRLRPKLPRDMETICLKCLEKKPRKRYPSAEALADDLHAFLGGAPIVAQPAGPLERAARWLRSRPARAALIGAGAAAAVGLLVGIWSSSALAVGAVAVLGLLAGIAWHHARLTATLRELALQQVAAERYAERLHLLGEMTRRLMTIPSVDKMLFLLGETAARLANAELATIYLVDRDRGELWSKVTLDASVGEIRVPLGVGIAGTVAVTGETIHIPDAYADSRFNPEIDRRSGYRTRNLLTFPMTGQDGRIVGVFQVINKRDGAFEAADEEVLSSLAASAAVAVEHARQRAARGQIAPDRPSGEEETVSCSAIPETEETPSPSSIQVAD